MTKYQATIGYKSVITINVKADSEDEAKQKAFDLFKKHRDEKMYSNKIELNDDNFAVHGILNIGETFEKIYE